MCRLFEGSDHVLPGWVCCGCRIYNGAQRPECKNCGHVYCGPKFEVTERETMTSLTGEVHEGVITAIRRVGD